MSTIMHDSTITVREFDIDDVYYRTNSDLSMQLRKGENTFGEFEDGVLVKMNVDGCGHCEVEVEVGTRSHQSVADILDAAIAAQIVVRDQHRKMAAA